MTDVKAVPLAELRFPRAKRSAKIQDFFEPYLQAALKAGPGQAIEVPCPEDWKEFGQEKFKQRVQVAATNLRRRKPELKRISVRQDERGQLFFVMKKAAAASSDAP